MEKDKSYGLKDFQRYHEEKMTAKEAHAFEKACMDDPFLNEAYEGFLSLNKTEIALPEVISSLETRMHQRIYPKEKQRIFLGYYIAAAVLLIAFGLAFNFYLSNSRDKRPTAIVSEKIPVDSVRLPFREPELITKLETKPVLTDTKPKRRIAKGQANDSAPAVASEENSVSLQDARIAHVEVKGIPQTVAPTSFQKMSPTAIEQVVDSLSVKGRVMDKNREPLPGVIVMNGKVGTVSNHNGDFTIPGKTGDSLRLNAVGYKTLTKDLDNTGLQTFEMVEDTQTLSDVVVVGYGKTSFSQTEVHNASDPEPLGGWSAYKLYLKKSSQNVVQKGTVKISFLVTEKGDFRDFITKGSSELFKSAIEIVQQGGGWKPGLVNGVAQPKRVTLTLRFRN